MTSPRPDPLHIFWRALSLLPVSIVVTACSSDGGGDWTELYHAVRMTLDSDNTVSLDQAGAIPFATLGIKINDDHEQILVLATDSHGERLWTSSAHVAITTRYGRVVQTAGLGQDLSSYYGPSGSSANFLTPSQYAWTADFRDMGLYAVPIACEIHPGVPDPITILGADLHTVRVDETCNSAGIGWSFTNTYWVAPDTNRVWRSIQHIHPDGMTVQIQILRPVVGEY